MEHKNKISSFRRALLFARANKGKLLTTEDEYRSNKKSEWACAKQHVFYSTLGNLFHFSRWCPTCRGTLKFGNKKYTIDDAIELAKKKKGKCLSAQYINSHEYLEWECSRGHRWASKFYLVKNLNNWCRKCSGSQKLSIEDMQNFAKTKNGKCLSIHYKDNKQKLLWECGLDHRWFARYNDISSGGSWCPECRLWKTQKEIYEIVRRICGEDKCSFNYRQFEWLRMPDTQCLMEIDIFVKNYKNKNIAIEYHGEQHFRPIEYFGGQKTLERTKYRDKIKKKLIESHKDEIDKFIIFTNKNYVSCENIKYAIESISSKTNSVVH